MTHSVEQNVEKKTERLENCLGISKVKKNFKRKIFSTIRFRSLTRWATSFINNNRTYDLGNSNYPVVDLKTVLMGFEGGKTPSKSNKSYWNGDVYWTSPKDFNGTVIKESQDKITEKAVQDGAKVYPKGTLLGVFRSGILRHSFPIAVTEIETAINQDLKAIIINPDKIRSEYLLRYLDTFQKLVLELSSKVGVTVESINSDEFINLPVILPPIIVQDKVIRELGNFNDQIYASKEKADNLKEISMTNFEKKLFNK